VSGSDGIHRGTVKCGHLAMGYGRRNGGPVPDHAFVDASALDIALHPPAASYSVLL